MMATTRRDSNAIGYSAVCALSNDPDEAVLIHKLKPTWQLNLANFPGGKVEASDGVGEPGHRACAVRELREEIGLVVEADNLKLFCVLRFDGGVCYFYACKTNIYKASTKETESVFVGTISDILQGVVSYLPPSGSTARDVLTQTYLS